MRRLRGRGQPRQLEPGNVGRRQAPGVDPDPSPSALPTWECSPGVWERPSGTPWPTAPPESLRHCPEASQSRSAVPSERRWYCGPEAAMGAAKVRPGDPGAAAGLCSLLPPPLADLAGGLASGWQDGKSRPEARRAASALLACVHADCLHPPLLPLWRLPRPGHSSALGSAQEPQTRGSGSRET